MNDFLFIRTRNYMTGQSSKLKWPFVYLNVYTLLSLQMPYTCLLNSQINDILILVLSITTLCEISTEGVLSRRTILEQGNHRTHSSTCPSSLLSKHPLVIFVFYLPKQVLWCLWVRQMTCLWEMWLQKGIRKSIGLRIHFVSQRIEQQFQSPICM